MCTTANAQVRVNHIHLSFRGKIGINNKRIRRSSDHLREPPQTAAAEIVAPGFRDPMLGAQRSALRDHGMRPEHYAHMLEGRKAGWQE
jgi:hypothetical protein